MSNRLFNQPPDLEAEVDQLLHQIPVGRVTTYGAIARALGDVVASRWVGHYLLHHPHNPSCPCHRVVRAGGELGAYANGSALEKGRRLQQDGVLVPGARVELGRFYWDAFRSSRPLIKLHDLQRKLADEVSLSGSPRHVRTVGGVDVSYTSGGQAVAACAVLDLERSELLRSATVRGKVRFPYISSFLAFRELPMLLEIVRQVQQDGILPDVWIVDGSGILHPRRAGIASMLGVVLKASTIGITKKLLCGEVSLKGMTIGEARPICKDGMPLGFALSNRPSSRRPLYISPGHRISVSQALEVIQRQTVRSGLPEVIYWADRLSRRAAKVTAT